MIEFHTFWFHTANTVSASLLGKQCMFTWVIGVGGEGSIQSVGFRQREGRG